MCPANPIFPLSASGGAFVFEVFEDDATMLKRRLGEIAGESFSGKLASLEVCRSTHPGLALLQHKPTMRAVIMVHKLLDAVIQ